MGKKEADDLLGWPVGVLLCRVACLPSVLENEPHRAPLTMSESNNGEHSAVALSKAIDLVTSHRLNSGRI